MASSYSSSLMVETNALLGNQEAVIDELVHGRDLATRLRALLSEPSHEIGSGSAAEGLVSEIMATFTNTLFMLDDRNDNDDSVGVENDSRFVEPPRSLDDGQKSEDSGESSTVARKNRRGCYKRRKSSKSWQRETPNLIDDGHAWRKYGQKAILKSKFPRNYFRCTHKYDQKCQATKQVQRIQEEPTMYRTTYYGSHTCRNLLNPPELVLDCPSPTQDNSNSMLLSFNLASKQSHHHHPFFSSSFNTTATTVVKQEFKDNYNYNNNEVIIDTAATMMPVYRTVNGVVADNIRSPDVSSDYIVLPDREGFDRRSDLECGVVGFDESFELEDDVLQHLDFD